MSIKKLFSLVARKKKLLVFSPALKTEREAGGTSTF
jgi:hypothetical protein